tara:strand:+ start:216 stop:617 length:402 start_codon:yes stop_codon:yes gene_type:complete
LKYLFIILLLIISCSEKEEYILDISYYENCDFIEEEIYEVDLFEGYITLEMNSAYVPDFNFTDSLLSDYYYLKFSNDSLKGIYVITDANVRYKINKVQPYDSVSFIEYPFSFNISGEKACVYLDLLKTENCDC